MLTPQEKGRKYEKRVSKELGYKAQPGSGNTWSKKGDSRSTSGKFLLEIKYTDAEVYKFEIDKWYEHELHAVQYGQIPVYIINFRGRHEVALMSSLDYYNLLPKDIPNYEFVPIEASGKTQYGLKRSDVKLMEYNEELSQTYPLLFAGQRFTIMQRQEFEDLKDFNEQL